MGVARRHAVEGEVLRLGDQGPRETTPQTAWRTREGHSPIAWQERGPFQPGQTGLAGTVQVGVENRAAAPRSPECQGELHRQGALADTSLAGADGDDVIDAGHRLGDALPLLEDLSENVGTAVAGDVGVCLHDRRMRSSTPVRSATERAAARSRPPTPRSG